VEEKKASSQEVLQAVVAEAKQAIAQGVSLPGAATLVMQAAKAGP
jgi:hypothetical protein